MDYSPLMQKIAAAQLQLHPTLRDVMDRVRETGLHKVAAQMHGVPAFEVRTAAQLLGRQVYLQRQRQMKIASGLRALNALAESGDLPFDVTASSAHRLGAVKVANMFRLGPQGIKNLIPEAEHAVAQQASHAMPKAVGPSVAESAQHSGLFGRFNTQNADEDLGQALARLRNEHTSMGIRPSAPASSGSAAAHAPAPTAAPKPSQFTEAHPELQALSDDVSNEMRKGLAGPQDVATGPYGTPDEAMWRHVYEETKAREALAATQGRGLPGLHPSAQSMNPTMRAPTPTPMAGTQRAPGLGAKPPPAPLAGTQRAPGLGSRPQPQMPPPPGPGNTAKLPQ